MYLLHAILAFSIHKPSPESIIQGGSLRTWSYSNMNHAQITLKTEGRVLDADVELWQGPDNTPIKLRVYSDNGRKRPLRAVLRAWNEPNTIAVRNTGPIEFPILSYISAQNVAYPSQKCLSSFMSIQGGAVRTFPFESCVRRVEMLLKTHGRPLNSRIEIIQGPCNNKQIVELYTDDGHFRPFFCIIETPGPGNVVRVINTGPFEFPMFASIVPRGYYTF